MPLPGCWDTKTEHFDYDGIGWYKKTIHLNKKGHALFNFEGVSGICEVFLDGVKLGKHNGSYTPFSFLKKSLSSGNYAIFAASHETGNDVRELSTTKESLIASEDPSLHIIQLKNSIIPVFKCSNVKMEWLHHRH